MRKYIMPIAALLVLLSNCNLRADVDVIPTPKYAKERKGNLSFGHVSLDFSPQAKDQAAEDELKSFFGKNLVPARIAGADAITIHARMIADNGFMDSSIPVTASDSALASDDGYILLIENGTIDILAKSRTGVFYAVATFLQLVDRNKKGYIAPLVSIADYPSLGMRGISDDISRGQISTMENFKKIIRFLATHKMNTYMPYIENLFAFKSYPGFSEGRDPLTAAQVSELDAYGRLYHVQVIPIFETLGHLEDVLEKPEFSKYAEFSGVACLNISSDSAFAFMKNLLAEISPAFSSDYFNMAADESFDVGLGASRALVDSVGIAEAHAQYYVKLYRVLKSLGKKVMMYGDIILKNPQILSEIPKDITIVDWHYGASFGYPSMKELRDAGFNVVASPAVWNFTGPFPNFYNSYANIENFARDCFEEGGMGLIVSTWNDNGSAELRELNYPGYAWGSECAWNPEGASPAHFETVFFRQCFQSNTSLTRIAYELLSSGSNQITWNEFWRVPFLDPREADAPTRVESIEATMPEVIALATQASRFVRANRNILDIYMLVARMNYYWARRVRGIMQMRRLAGDSALSAKESGEEITAIEKDLLDMLAKIRREYVRIYLRTNRRPLLQLIEQRFDDQEASLRAGTEQLLGGNAKFDQKLVSKFIYYPESLPCSQGKTQVDSATFVKTVNFGNLQDNAEVQLIGDTYCRLFINGALVGDVKARRTLTWDVEMKRVKFFYVRKFLRKGKNTFVIQAANYDRDGSAGYNLLAVVGRDTLTTDSTWQVVKGIAPVESTGRRRAVNAAAYDNGWTVSAPDFGLKLKSWIER